MEWFKRHQQEIIRYRNLHSIATGMDKLLLRKYQKNRKILTYSRKGLKVVKGHIIGDWCQIWPKKLKSTKAKKQSSSWQTKSSIAIELLASTRLTSLRTSAATKTTVSA